MARISGVDLPREKRIEIGLTYIYGIGRKTAGDIINATGINAQQSTITPIIASFQELYSITAINPNAPKTLVVIVLILGI